MKLCKFRGDDRLGSAKSCDCPLQPVFIYGRRKWFDAWVPIPLFNLVYHDCMVVPWMMDADQRRGTYMLYALLNGGAAYLNCEAEGKELEKEIERYRTVAQLQEKVAYSEMVRHEFLDGNYKKQRTVFADGTEVTVDLEAGTYQIHQN